MKLDSQRDLFDLPDDIIYLNCASQSPQLKETTRTGQASIARKARPWNLEASERLANVETARELFGRIIGASADSIAMVPSVSYGVAVAAANIPIRKGQEIVMVEEEFPSDYYSWQMLARSKEASIVTVKRPPDFDWTSAVVAQIGENTAIVTVPNCHWTDGSLIDLGQVGQRVREVGAALVVDVTQSAGAGRLDMAEIQPDFLVSAGYKWLLSPYSQSFLYVSPKYWDGTPLELSPFNRAGSEDYSVTRYLYDFRPGARRFDVGERSDFVNLPMANTALRQILAWGVENIAETLADLTGQIEKNLAGSRFKPVPAPRRMRHMVGLRVTEEAGAESLGELADRLAAQKIFVSVRGQNLRISPYLYNTPEEIELFTNTLLGKS
jgi:selenocysteine lyase/cysteine desulfurase